MKYQFIFITISFLLIFSGCQSVKKNNNFAIVVTPIDLPITPEKDENPDSLVYDFVALFKYMSLYDFLRDNNFKVDIVSKDPLIYRIPDQEGLLEELAGMLNTIRKMILFSKCRICTIKSHTFFITSIDIKIAAHTPLITIK